MDALNGTDSLAALLARAVSRGYPETTSDFLAGAADTLGAPSDLVAAVMRRSGMQLREPALGSQDLRRVFGVSQPPQGQQFGGLYGLGQALGWSR